MDKTACNTREDGVRGSALDKPTVTIELVYPAREVPDEDAPFEHAYAYGFADMIYYCWLCDRIPLIMEERHPSFLFKAELVAPDCAMHGIPGYVDVIGIDFPDDQSHLDDEDELCFGTHGFSDEVLGLASELQVEPWDVNLTDEHRRMPWEDTPEMRELVDKLTDWGGANTPEGITR